MKDKKFYLGAVVLLLPCLILVTVSFCQESPIRIEVYALYFSAPNFVFKEAALTRNRIEAGLSKHPNVVVRHVSQKEAIQRSFEDLMKVQMAKDIKTRADMVLIVEAKEVQGDAVLVFTALGGPSLKKVENFVVRPDNIDAALTKISKTPATGYGHILFDILTIPARTDIYVDDNHLTTTDNRGRFNQTFTWPAGDYRVVFTANIRGTQKHREEVATIVVKETLVFRKNINLEK